MTNSSDKSVVTIRVSKDVKRAFEQACAKVKRSMSKQGELLIEIWLSTVDKKDI